MTFTKDIPTTPGDYAWRFSERNDLHNVCVVFQSEGRLWVEISGRGEMCWVETLGGEWCRLVPAEEVEKAWDESRNAVGCWGECHALTDSDLSNLQFKSSRAKRVMEGKE